MKYRFTTLVIVMFALCHTAAISFAGTLTSAGMDKFMTSMELLDKADNEGKLSSFDMDLGDDISSMIDQSGRMILFRTLTEQIKTSPSEHATLQKITRQSGYSSVAEWARASDGIIMVYMRTEVNASDFSDMEQITPEMLEMFPPEQRANMESALRMMQALKNIPQSDIDTFIPFKERLDALFD